MMPIEEYYEKVYRLAYIVRYSNVPRVKDESVAEHSFFVAAIVMKLHSKYDFDLGRALQMAIAHDMPESETNDISWAIKQRYPKIKEVLAEAEDDFANSMPCSVQVGLVEYSRCTIESDIVKLADAMQCLQYANHEVLLGNRGYMLSVVDSSTKRIAQLEEELVDDER